MCQASGWVSGWEKTQTQPRDELCSSVSQQQLTSRGHMHCPHIILTVPTRPPYSYPPRQSTLKQLILFLFFAFFLNKLPKILGFPSFQGVCGHFNSFFRSLSPVLIAHIKTQISLLTPSSHETFNNILIFKFLYVIFFFKWLFK